ncbi:aldose 1-epimerase family protein [Ectobacillus sp. JY-23]|uniref:aldose 1-epimerase family protein n=1 Tax=Ectobacillus sp. JY-23 TaxID=2933872 RepID=UPI001FF4D175|nr:aldose 1-epimerase family protein [Ectobacillus sp. JY-23]UOY91136.1 aldose 1-epimerase family protein [Ectobacillus sp. JY-23]
MHVIENNWLKVTIAELGAEMRNVLHKKNGLSYMWTGDSTYWGRVSPVLFPIVGRLKDNQYQLDGQTYELPQHGFLRDVVFQVAEQKDDSISFVCESAGRFAAVYPYEFKVTIQYILQEASLQIRWEVENQNEEKMYFSIGGHPAFRIPLLENEQAGDYTLQMTASAGKQVHQYELKDALIAGKCTVKSLEAITIAPSLFAGDALVYDNINTVTMTNASHHGVKVTLSGFPFVGIWSKYNESDGTMAPFVCIEPWYGIADTYETSGNMKEKLGVNVLEAGETFQSEYIIAFQ